MALLKRWLWLMLGIALLAAGLYALRARPHRAPAAARPHADIDPASKQALDRILEQSDREEKSRP